MATTTVTASTLNAVSTHFARMRRHPDFADSASPLDALVGPWRPLGFTLPANGLSDGPPAGHVLLRHRDGQTFLLLDEIPVAMPSDDPVLLMTLWSRAVTGTWEDIATLLMERLEPAPTDGLRSEVSAATTLALMLCLHDATVCAAPSRLLSDAYRLVAAWNRADLIDRPLLRQVLETHTHNLGVGSPEEHAVLADVAAHMNEWAREQPDEDFYPEQFQWTDIAWEHELEDYLAVAWPAYSKVHPGLSD